MKENVIQINGGITVNVDVYVENLMYKKYIIFGIPLHVILKMENIQQVLWIIQRLCATKLQNHTMKKQTISTIFNEKKATCKMQSLYILLAFLLIAIALLIALSIYCYFVKYQAKKKTFITISQHK